MFSNVFFFCTWSLGCISSILVVARNFTLGWNFNPLLNTAVKFSPGWVSFRFLRITTQRNLTRIRSEVTLGLVLPRGEILRVTFLFIWIFTKKDLHYGRFLENFMCFCNTQNLNTFFYMCMGHCVKSVRIQSYSGPYSVRMRENTNQKISEYGHFSRCGYLR